jgi:hypothetical protein
MVVRQHFAASGLSSNDLVEYWCELAPAAYGSRTARRALANEFARLATDPSLEIHWSKDKYYCDRKVWPHAYNIVFLYAISLQAECEDWSGLWRLLTEVIRQETRGWLEPDELQTLLHLGVTLANRRLAEKEASGIALPAHKRLRPHYTCSWMCRSIAACSAVASPARWVC